MVDTKLKYAILAGLILLAWIFAVAGAATPYATYKKGEFKSEWRYDKAKSCLGGRCNTVNKGDWKCTAMKDYAGTVVVFSVLALLVQTAALVLAIIVVLSKVTQLPGPLGGLVDKFKLGVVGGCAIAALFLFIAWPVSFSMLSSMKCSDQTLKDANEDIKTGPSPVLLLFSFFFMIGGIVVWVVLKESDGTSSTATKPVSTEKEAAPVPPQ